MGTNYVCPRCGNTDPKYIGFLNGKPYCRRCIVFKGEEISYPNPKPKNAILSLDYHLSKEQEKLSNRIINNYLNGTDTLCWAVCGSGKTEISYGLLCYGISHGLTCGFALPRRDVVIELFFRLRDAFPNNSVVAVYGQHTGKLSGDIIVLTTHQLYRYKDYFDVLVMDEIDAFPFKGSEVLYAMFKRSLRGHYLMMSATPSPQIKKEFKKPGHDVVQLHTRFHKRPIPVPKIKVLYGFLKYIFLIRKLREYRKDKKPCFVFVPTVELSKTVFNVVGSLVPNGDYVSSKRESRPQIIADFKAKREGYLITTAVLERGVTIKNIQIIIFNADDSIYDSSALIQISGRAGRKKDASTGEVFFLANKETKSMKGAIDDIKFCNTFL